MDAEDGLSGGIVSLTPAKDGSSQITAQMTMAAMFETTEGRSAASQLGSLHKAKPAEHFCSGGFWF